MQIKKDDIRDNILAAAEKEFLKRGFKNSSMRTIAAKSHTTLGNLYNYFQNKEAILDVIIGDTPDQIYKVLNEHQSYSESFPLSKEEMEDNFDDLVITYMPRFFPLELLLSNSLIILMEGCEGTKYEPFRQIFFQLFQNHIAFHLKVESNSFLAKSMAHGFLSSLIFIGKNKKNMEDGRKDLLNYIRTMVLGMPINRK